MMSIFRHFSLGKILLVLIVWFLFLRPWLMMKYNLFAAFYWWMRP